MKLDPILLEILQTQMQAVTEEMAITLARTARSTYVKDAADFATALVNKAGKFFAYPANMGVSGFLDLDCGVAIAAIPDLEVLPPLPTVMRPPRLMHLLLRLPSLQNCSLCRSPRSQEFVELRGSLCHTFCSEWRPPGVVPLGELVAALHFAHSTCGSSTSLWSCEAGLSRSRDS